MTDRDLDEVIREFLAGNILADQPLRRAARQLVREGRRDLLTAVLRAPQPVYGPLLDALLGPPGAPATGELDRRTAVGLASSLGDAVLLERFLDHFCQRHGEDLVNTERLTAQLGEERRYAQLLERPDAASLQAAQTADPERWFVELLRRASQRKSPPRLLDVLQPLGIEPSFDSWLRAVFDALGDVAEIRPAVAGWIEEEVAARGWSDRLLHTTVTWALDRHASQAQTAALLLATPVWRAAAQDLILDRLSHGSMVLDGPGRRVLATLGLAPRVIRALEAYADRSSRLAREEAAVEMAERLRRQNQQQIERLLPDLHRVIAELELTIARHEGEPSHHHQRMREALAAIMAALGVETFGTIDEQVPYRLAIHRYIGQDAPPPPEAPVRVIEPGLRQMADGGQYRIVRKALVT
jgi:hypothetical protein